MSRFLAHLCRSAAALWLTAALTSAETTPVATVVTGPWLNWTGRGYEVALVVEGTADALAKVRFTTGTTPPQPCLNPRPLIGGGTVLAWNAAAPASTARQRADPQPYSIALSEDRQRTGLLPPTPLQEAEVAIAIAGTSAWPNAHGLERLSHTLGTPIQAVLVLDALDLPKRLGQGGWESSLPIIVLGNLPRSLSPWLGTGQGYFPTGLSWGALGLPVAEDPQSAARALGMHKSLWTVPCAPSTPWDPALIAPRDRSDQVALIPLVRLAYGLSLPLILGGGSLSGLLTDPLALTESGDVVGRAGGTRFLLVPGLGDGLAHIGPDLAIPFDMPALTGLAADEDRLTLAVLPKDREEATVATWQASPAATAPLPGGPGGGDPVALTAILKAGLPADPAPGPEAVVAAEAAADALALLPYRTLRTVSLTPQHWQQLLAPAVGSEQSAPWQRRLVSRMLGDGDIRARFAPRLAMVPDWARRHVIQRLMSDPHEVVATWLDAVAGGADPVPVRAAILRAQRSTKPEDYAVLVERLRRQAAGTVAVDLDPVLQSQLIAAVFTSPWLSPTPLRPIARDLAPRVGALAQAELARFTARQGAERPITSP